MTPNVYNTLEALKTIIYETAMILYHKLIKYILHTIQKKIQQKCDKAMSYMQNHAQKLIFQLRTYYNQILELHQFSSVTQSCPTLCNPMDCSTPGLPVHHQLLEFTQTHVYHVGDAIQPSHPVVPFSFCRQSFPASGSFPMSQFFASGGHSTGVSASAAVIPMNIQD